MTASPFTHRLIPEAVYFDPTGEWLLWDPWDGGMHPAEFYADEPLVDRLAALARPSSPTRLAGRVLELASRYGPLSWCSGCLNLHRLDWRMTSPGPVRRGTPMKEWLPDWARAAQHVSALRRIFMALQDGHAAPADWQIVWPTRTDAYAWGDLEWERREVARHLSSWRQSCHIGSGVTWVNEPARLEMAGSLLGDLGARLSDELLTHTRYRVCTGSVAGEACGVTTVMVRERERSGPMLCDRCDELRRKRLQRTRQNSQVSEEDDDE